MTGPRGRVGESPTLLRQGRALPLRTLVAHLQKQQPEAVVAKVA